MQQLSIFAIENSKKSIKFIGAINMTGINYANNIFGVQEIVNNCATDILNAHADYENSRNIRKQAQADDDEYNQLVDAYNVLLAKAKKIAQYHREEQNQNASLQERIASTYQQNEQLVQENQELSNIASHNGNEILALKAQLKTKDQELQKTKEEVMNLRETVFTFTLVNTILSTNSTALKNVLNGWNDSNIYKKQGFINVLKDEVKKADFAKNQIPATNSVEAFAYLKSNNKPLFDKLQNFSF